MRERNLTPAATEAIAKCLTDSCDATREVCLREVVGQQSTRDEDRRFRSKCTDSHCNLNTAICGEGNRTELLTAERVVELTKCLDNDCTTTAGAVATQSCIFNLLPPGS